MLKMHPDNCCHRRLWTEAVLNGTWRERAVSWLDADCQRSIHERECATAAMNRKENVK